MVQTIIQRLIKWCQCFGELGEGFQVVLGTFDEILSDVWITEWSTLGEIKHRGIRDEQVLVFLLVVDGEELVNQIVFVVFVDSFGPDLRVVEIQVAQTLPEGSVKKFLMALSVRPGISLAMSDHFLPWTLIRLNRSWRSMLSESSLDERQGRRWLSHLN